MRALQFAGVLGLALLMSLSAGAGHAQPAKHPSGGHPGPHPGGGPHFPPHPGGGPHFSPHVGGGPHFSPHVNVVRHFSPHFAPHAVSHVHIGGRHFTAGPRIGRVHGHVVHGHVVHGHVVVHGRVHAHGRFAHEHPSTVHGNRGALVVHRTTPNLAGTVAAHNFAHPPHTRLTGRIDPHRFAALRHFSRHSAFQPFLAARWHRHRHWGWLGPLFWPYAYGDFFYDALWPYEYGYYDPFWYYGYGDVYEGIFSPYDYTEYVQGPGAAERMNTLTQAVAQSCTDEAAEVTGWPIDQIEAALKPNAEQNALLDDLGNAIVRASDAIRTHCPTALSFTPTGRIAQMQERLQGLVQAVAIVEPALRKFYDALSDEQKARFNDIGTAQAKPPANGQASAANPQAECTESIAAFPADRINQMLHPSDAQRQRLDTLQAANAKAAALIKNSCPSELPATPPDRLAAEGKHLTAMLQAVRTIGPPLDDFYNSLSDEQKARFNKLGRQLFAQK